MRRFEARDLDQVGAAIMAARQGGSKQNDASGGSRSEAVMAEHLTAEDRLREYFQTAESVAGLKSIHGAMVDMAQSGGGGTRGPTSPEDRWYDARRSQVRRHAESARALRSLSSLLYNVGWAYCGSPGWPGEAHETTNADVAIGAREDLRRAHWWRTQPPPEVRKALGADLGRVALLTSALDVAHETLEAAGKVITRERTLVVLCKASRCADCGSERECAANQDPLHPVAHEARALVRAFLEAFCLAAGLEPPESAERAQRRRERRERPSRRPPLFMGAL